MIFKIHPENIFGIKKLTRADLGQNEGHQTHIGLYDGILSYLSNEDEIQQSYLIFKDKCERLDCYFDRIKNQDGTFRSPKIRTGQTDSIVRRIREYASNMNQELYLMWFSLDNKELLFLLFEEGSEDYNFFKYLNLVRVKAPFSENIQNYIFSRFNQTNENIMVELELSSQGIRSNRTYRRVDIDRANELFRQTGKIGEELIFRYLSEQKVKSKIKDFSWMNQSRESGLPYDFRITQNDNKERFVDVKTTRFNFESPLVFSSQETSFITHENVLYSVYRTYNIAHDEPKLRICNNSRDKMQLIDEDYHQYLAMCESHGYRTQSSFLVLPTDSMLTFTHDIIL